MSIAKIAFFGKCLRRLWHDDAGALITTEWLTVASLLVLGTVAGLTALQKTLTSELSHVAGALGTLSQSYSLAGQQSPVAGTPGGAFRDAPDSVAVRSTAACTSRACD